MSKQDDFEAKYCHMCINWPNCAEYCDGWYREVENINLTQKESAK